MNVSMREKREREAAAKEKEVLGYPTSVYQNVRRQFSVSHPTISARRPRELSTPFDKTFVGSAPTEVNCSY